MAYIIKNTSGLINTRFTDVGRQKLSEGRLNIQYFQVGDSEISYNAISGYNQSNTFILQSEYNAQNATQQPQTNKMNVKYPYYVNGSSGNTYGLVVPDSEVTPIYNVASVRGFFTGDPYQWSAITLSSYTKTAEWYLNTCDYCGSASTFIHSGSCSPTSGTPAVGDYAVIYYDGIGGCGGIGGNFPILFYKIQAYDDINNILTFDRALPNFTGTPLTCYNYTIVNSTLPTRYYGYYDCYGNHIQNVPISGFTTVEICATSVDIQTELSITQEGPCTQCCADARILIYPSGMTELYDTYTPNSYWPPEVINFDSICDLGATDVKVWNMNIPWSVSPAGLKSSLNEDYTKFGSTGYLGSKEYFGYQSTSGQTFWLDSTLSAETTDSYYYNSYDEKIKVQPYEQKAIAIIHYTNNAVDNFYGEKFAMEEYDATAIDTTGFARNFKVTIPWLMWHKSKTGLMGETFYVDPNVGTADYFKVKYMKSSKNEDMNEPGLRYFHLWDTHLNDDGNPSRVGKVFPDLKTIIFDDDEIIAALSYKSNRNWTLPAPKLSLMVPNACDTIDDDYGLMGSDEEYLYVTYRFNSSYFTNSLHCNYYTKIQGAPTCVTTQRQDVSVKFGPEFGFLGQCCFQGYSANELYILAQMVTGSTTQPNPAAWKIIDYTNQLSGSSIVGYITQSGLTANTFTIRYNQYLTASTYNLDNYIDLPNPTLEEDKLNFGDEYFFYGNIESDIEATIYEMRFLCNLSQTQFNNTSNPSWTSGSTSYMTEVGLFDDEKDLIVISKFQTPTLRQGTQQISVKLDF